MVPFQFQNCALAGVMLISPKVVFDQRGYLSKPFDKAMLESNGIRLEVEEELESRSSHNTLRGLHFQRSHSQDKLVRVLSGEVYDVAVDLRPESPTFGRWQGFRLSAENRNMLYIPKQFAHGFLVLGGEAVLHYLCGDRYDPASEDGILWSDPELAISWPLENGTVPELSDRDRAFQGFAAFRRSIGQR